MQGYLRLLGAEIDHIEYCPHGPDDGCECRKPKPGMLQVIARKFNASLVDLPVIGDSDRDIQAAINVGARPILVLSGNGEKHLIGGRIPQGVEVYKSLLEAAKRLIHPE